VTSERPPQRDEVRLHRPHVAGERRTARRRLDRVEHGGPHVRVACEGVRDPGRHQPLGEHRGQVVAPDEIAQLGEPLRIRLLLGRDPGDRPLFQAVARREAGEGRVGGDDHMAPAVGQAGPVLPIEPRERGVEAGRPRRNRRPL
jgi:hypothetical protein